ncbi:hypothetical protein BJY52DRAFT_817770 [Lactarius psammicola]|nr:hypothetical protein BJY52DRAFT_817770 [Lactarius psammicola]
MRHGSSIVRSSSSSRPPNRTALRSGPRPGSSAKTTRGRAACPRSLPRKRASKPPERAKLRVGVCGGTLDATVDDALAVSGVKLELVVVVVLPLARGFLSAERAGGGKRREGERGGECGCVGDGECEREDEGGHRELELGRVLGVRGGVEELGEDVLRWRRGSGAGGYKCARCAGKCGVRERWSPMAICWQLGGASPWMGPRVRSGCEELGKREVEIEIGKRTGEEGYLSWSCFSFEKGRLRDERSRVGMGREESSRWGEEDIRSEIALKVELCLVSRSVSDSAECLNPITIAFTQTRHNPRCFSCEFSSPNCAPVLLFLCMGFFDYLSI